MPKSEFEKQTFLKLLAKNWAKQDAEFEAEVEAEMEAEEEAERQEPSHTNRFLSGRNFRGKTAR
jgi:hypothetical protein